MIVTPIQFDLFLPQDLDRSPGVHVSSIIRCIAIENGILTNVEQEELSLVDIREITDKTSILRMSLGLAWEQYYIPVILSRYGVADHPGEMEYDGVFLTHDGESVSVIITVDHQPAGRMALFIHEVKATYKSIRTVGDLSSQWMWLTQMKAYCKARGTRFAMLHVLFICGNYVFPITPQLQAWQIEFTQQELDETWYLLKEYKNNILYPRNAGAQGWLE